MGALFLFMTFGETKLEINFTKENLILNTHLIGAFWLIIIYFRCIMIIEKGKTSNGYAKMNALFKNNSILFAQAGVIFYLWKLLRVTGLS